MLLELVYQKQFNHIDVLNKPFYIAGPCSAETPIQIQNTYQTLEKSGIVHAFRAGVWKPRTRPGQFEGMGEPALQWLSDVRKTGNLPIMTEVATPQHVELALKYDLDMLWIGARSTTNPFTVQEIAEALRGVKLPIFVKNPVNPDLALWLGAIERLQKVGINDISAIHRGFSVYGNHDYRNAPIWQIPIEFRTHLPEMRMICDPSHITGKREKIASFSQEAMDLGFDGLIIETHPEPEKAWSDAAQQVTPQKLIEILINLTIPQERINNLQIIDKLSDLRILIDKRDKDLIAALNSRMKIVAEIGHFKHENNMPIFNLERWMQIFSTRKKWAKEQDLDENFIYELYKLIHDESIRIQMQQELKR